MIENPVTTLLLPPFVLLPCNGSINYGTDNDGVRRDLLENALSLTIRRTCDLWFPDFSRELAASGDGFNIRKSNWPPEQPGGIVLPVVWKWDNFFEHEFSGNKGINQSRLIKQSEFHDKRRNRNNSRCTRNRERVDGTRTTLKWCLKSMLQKNNCTSKSKN